MEQVESDLDIDEAEEEFHDLGDEQQEAAKEEHESIA
jgi:hypothetical protein